MSSSLRTLYPTIEPYMIGTLQVTQKHRLAFEQSGNPQGIPVVVLHGGPGTGSYPLLRRFFNPAIYRIILFDQRGAGQSKPYASLDENTTWNLVGDIEKIRVSLGISSWLVFGGSWGSTLALAYAITYAESVKGLILNGVFLGTLREINWLYREGASRVFPDYWEELIAPIPRAEHGDILGAYHRRLTGGDDINKMDMAMHWAKWESRISILGPRPSNYIVNPWTSLALARIETHYFVNNCFLYDCTKFILDEKKIARISDIPGMIIQGRYDMVCPFESAWALHKLWSSSSFYVSDGAGHSAGEPTTTNHLIEATDGFHQLFL